MLHVVCAIEIEPQYELKDEHGTFVAQADLWLQGTHSLHEYDGEVHLPRAQQRKDLARARRIGNVTWIRRGYTSHEVLHQGVSILRDADLASGRPHDARRIRPWHQLLAASLFTPSGRRRLESRLGIEGPSTGQSGGRVTVDFGPQVTTCRWACAAAVWNFAPLAGDGIADLHCP